MFADLGKQTVTDWCERLRNRKVSLIVLCSRHKFTESSERLWPGRTLCAGK